MTVAAILGSAFQTPTLQGVTLRPREVETPWGPALVHEVPEHDAFVLFRHGVPHQYLPHQLNTRAHISALAQLEVGGLLLTSSVGVLDATLPLFTPLVVGDLLMPENRLPNGELCTFFKEPSPRQGHLVLDEGLFNRALTADLRTIAAESGHALFDGEVVFAFSPGPRTKTRAENALWAQLGAQVNSMSLGPEVVLANEAEMAVAALVVGHKTSLSTPSEQALDRDALARSLVSAREGLEALVWHWLCAAKPRPFANRLYRF